jgi:hypothetical protein
MRRSGRVGDRVRIGVVGVGRKGIGVEEEEVGRRRDPVLKKEEEEEEERES